MYKIYLKKRKGWSDDVANYVEKTVTLQQVVKTWSKHIDTMSKLEKVFTLEVMLTLTHCKLIQMKVMTCLTRWL